jgi:BMFP domain-containing protein YqiC
MDPYEELKKLKELLDLDIVTKEEFEAKKKQLLDL